MLFELLIHTGIFASVLMFIIWLLQIKINDASYVDVFWALALGIVACYVTLTKTTLDIRHVIIGILPVLWSLRLSTYLWVRISKSATEDSRYMAMRAAMGDKAHLGFFVFFQAQALFVVMFATPIVISLLTTEQQWQYTDTLALIIVAIAITGESIADKQLHEFKKDNKGKNVTCQNGLWNYSRHPNYFFEWIHWFAYALFSISSEYFWVTAVMPFLMLIFLLKLTGIPHVERVAVKRKPDYQHYINTTSAFIPWFKKK